MELKTYKKEYDYSYSLGAFPTIELIKNKKENLIKVLIHSSFNNENVLQYINENVDKDKIQVNDKMINKLSTKENVYVIGVFSKYTSKLNRDKDHLILDNPSNMGNLGTIIRSSLGFGIKDVAIIRPGVDSFDPKAIRSSMGSIFSINIEYFDSIEDYDKEYSNHTKYAFMLKAKKSLREEEFKNKPVSLVFGNEATGLPDKYLDENSLIIKHSNEIDSLNITNAVSIALYEYHEKTNI